MNELIETIANLVTVEIPEGQCYVPKLQPEEYKAVSEKFSVRYLGNGVARVAFEIDGHAYKFLRIGTKEYSQSHDEMERYATIRANMESDPERYEGWSIPEMEFFSDSQGNLIVKAELIDGEPVSGWDNPFGSGDGHSGNVRLYNGIKYMIDLG